MISFFKKKKKNKKFFEIEPDEILIDSQNIPGFNIQQFEGRLEKPYPKIVFYSLIFVFFLIIAWFLSRLYLLQIKDFKKYQSISEQISLLRQIVFADRGLIYDRNLNLLAWNEKIDNYDFLKRNYIPEEGFAHVLGYVTYPQKDKNNFYWQKEIKGIDGVEKYFDTFLAGKNGEKITEIDVSQKIQSENIYQPAQAGKNIILSIDSKIQKEIFQKIKSNISYTSYEGVTFILMNAQTGEILVLTNYPEYSNNQISSSIFKKKNEEEKEKTIKKDKSVFLNKAISGLFVSGSVIKPIIALGALNEKIIDANKKIFSAGYIEVPNPYFPDKPSIFKDWRPHGYVDMKKAIAVSSNVYFYTIGGGFENQIGLGINNIEKYLRLFGLGELTGIELPGEERGNIPSPSWKQKKFHETWKLGDTYNVSIGQYGIQVTPIQIATAFAIISQSGKVIRPTILKIEDQNFDQKIKKLNINDEYFKIIKEGLRMAVTEGTASQLNFYNLKIAAKTGTAQVGDKKHINSWVAGFFPFENPQYVFVTLLEKGKSKETFTATSLARIIFSEVIIPQIDKFIIK